MSGKFTVRYTSVIFSLMGPICLMAIFFGIAWACLELPFLQAALERDAQGGRGPAPLIAALIFGGLGLLVCLEVLVSAAKIIAGVPALTIDAEGCRGFHMWLPQRVRWADYLTSYRKGNTLFIDRKPPSVAGEMGQIGEFLTNMFRFDYKICVPLKGTDKTEEEIMQAITEYFRIWNSQRSRPFAQPYQPSLFGGPRG